MAQKVNNNELSSLNAEQIQVKIEEFRRALFGLRLSSTNAHVKNYSQFKKLRKNIARGLTLLSQKQSEKIVQNKTTAE